MVSDECYLLIDFSGTTCLLEIPFPHSQYPPPPSHNGPVSIQVPRTSERAICVVQWQHFFQILWSLGLISVPCDVQMSERHWEVPER